MEARAGENTCPAQRPPKRLLTLGTRLYVEYFISVIKAEKLKSREMMCDVTM
jgi:hypothetical protein